MAVRELLDDGVFREERWRRPSPRALDADGTFPIFFFEVAGETVWGATARILTELCSLVVGRRGALAAKPATTAQVESGIAGVGLASDCEPEGAVAEVEIGIYKSGRQAYGFDDIAIVPSRRTRDPEDVDISWQLDAFRFELPLLGAAMDGVVSPATAIELGRLGGAGVLNLEGLWTRYEDPTPLFDEIRELDDDKATAADAADVPRAGAARAGRPSGSRRSAPRASSRSRRSPRSARPSSPRRAPRPSSTCS